MSSKAAQVPDFYNELMSVLSEVNADSDTPISFRRAVVEGMGLRDSFTGKIKSHAYFPTTERIESLAKLLGVPPYRFRSYANRLARTAIVEDPDPRFIELFEMLAPLPKEPYDVIVNGLLSFTRKALTESAS